MANVIAEAAEQKSVEKMLGKTVDDMAENAKEDTAEGPVGSAV